MNALLMVTIHYQANNISDVVGNNHSEFLSDPSPIIVLPGQSVLQVKVKFADNLLK